MEIDRLTHYPTDITPPAWELNGVFLDVLKRSHENWLAGGYNWQFGLECSFRLLPASRFNFKKMTEAKIETALVIPNNRLLHQAWQVMPKKTPTSLYKKTLEEIKQNAERFASDNHLPVEDILRDLEGYKKDFEGSSLKQRKRARENIYLAWLHGTDSAQGGIRDLIEPRFGDYLHGVGWWDASIHAEVRIPKTDDPLEFIVRYHEILDRILKSAPKFGFGVDFVHTPHIHFSIWKKGRALLAPIDKTKSFRRDVAMGLTQLAATAPYLLNDASADLFETKGFMEFKSYRVHNGFRQLEDRWEWRRQMGEEEVGFLARDLAVLLTGAALPLMGPDQKQKFVQFGKDYKFEFEKHPEVRHVFGDTQSSLRSLIGHAKIIKGGQLRSSFAAIDWLLYALSREVGQHAVSDFKDRNYKFEPMYDLNIAEGWRKLVSSLEIGADLSLKTDHLTSELKSLFARLEVTGINSYVKSQDINLTLGPSDQLDFINRITPWIYWKAVTEEECEKIKSHYQNFYSQGLSCQAKMIVGVLSKEFSSAAADIEDPMPVILKWMARLREKTGSYLVMAFTTAIARNISIIGEGDMSRESLMVKTSYMNELRPHFQHAVEVKIKNLRGTAQPDNRQISFLEATKTYVNEKWYGCSDTFETFSREFFKDVQAKIKRDAATHLDLTAGALFHALYLEEMNWQKIYDEQISDADMFQAFEKDQQLWKAFFKTYQHDCSEDMKANILWQKFCAEISRSSDDFFNQNLKIMARLRSQKKPEFSPGLS